MNSKHWETSYRRAITNIRMPSDLDDKVQQGIRGVKPIRPIRQPRQSNGLLSKAASGFSAVALAVVLLHPAQYIGATPGQPEPVSLPVAAKDPWQALRNAVEAGNYRELCAEWRRQQRAEVDEELPSDLAARARQHCRILP